MSRKGENIFKRKDGRWEARYIHHYENGKAKYRYIYGKTYTEAKLRRMEAMSESPRTTLAVCKRLATVEQVAWAWLQDVKGSVKESTYTRYYRIMTKTILPRTGNLSVCTLDARAINDFAAELLVRGGKHGQPLSPKTVTDVLCTMRSMLNFGAAQGYPCTTTGGIRYPKNLRSEITLFNNVDRERLETAAFTSEDTTSLGILFAVFLGLRIGEVCGLRWNDLNFEDSTIRICRTVERIADLDPGSTRKTKVIISEPKTENAFRTIPIPQFLINHARKFRADESSYLLTGTDRFLEPHGFYLRYKRYLKDHDIKDHTFHALRHTFATRCVEYGFDAKSLSEILGHASVATTMAFYVHPSIEAKRSQLERLAPPYLS